MRAFGADVVLVPSDNGMITPGLFNRMREALDHVIHDEDAYWTDQFHNTDAFIIPPLLTRDLYDAVLTVDEIDARALAVTLARTEGIFAGTSSALNIEGALHLAKAFGLGKTVATVTCDTGLKYLTGDLFRNGLAL